MSNTLEFEGKNVEQALADASKELNVPADQIQYEVITYGSTGIFGLVGVKKAKIRVSVKTKPEDSIDTSLPTLKHKKNSDAVLSEKKSDFSDDEAVDIVTDALYFGEETLHKIIRAFSEEATIKANQKENILFYMISGGNSSVLIGKRGQTLEAIQYLVEKVVNKKKSDRFRVVVDVGGYLEKRKTLLKQLAQRMAEKAKKIGKPVTVGQMNAHDRRIVHLHLKNTQGVRTHSVGDGYYRKLVIFPKKTRPMNPKEKN